MKKYKVFYKNEWFYGDDAERIANSISRSYSIDINKAKEHVNKNIKPAIKSGTSIAVGRTPGYMAESPKKKNVEVNKAVSGANALLHNVGGDVVEQIEINRRAGICSACKPDSDGRGGLTEYSGCKACGAGKAIAKITNIIKQQFGKGFTIPNGLDIYSCDVCRCSLTVMLPAHMKEFKHNDDEKRPDHCWVKKTSHNYRDL